MEFANATVERYVKVFQEAYASRLHAHLMPLIRETDAANQKMAPSSVRMRPIHSLTNDVTDHLNQWLEARAKEFEASTHSSPMRIEDGSVVQPTVEELWREWTVTMLQPWTQRWLGGAEATLLFRHENADAQQDRGHNISV